jgi:hypothetical protein
MDADTDEPGWVHNEAGGRSNAYMVVESSKLAPLLVALSAVALLVAGLALGISLWSTNSYARDYKELERESRLLQLKVDEFRVALLHAKINPNLHLEGETQ